MAQVVYIIKEMWNVDGVVEEDIDKVYFSKEKAYERIDQLFHDARIDWPNDNFKHERDYFRISTAEHEEDFDSDYYEFTSAYIVCAKVEE